MINPPDDWDDRRQEEDDEYPWAGYTADDLSLFATEPPEPEEADE